jgi:hypothetical protein
MSELMMLLMLVLGLLVLQTGTVVAILWGDSWLQERKGAKQKLQAAKEER